ncbi:unnamed protein product [Lepeophtheirus salmonis]|uniref:(salmon louse) hypothetical protein n=1 Tax=Lepeophtheirus salmonis TaxID=72036 RepID=A0A817FE35_LEPSM|nr:unnamed protein product [Lepeophtheirus salmonis]
MPEGSGMYSLIFTNRKHITLIHREDKSLEDVQSLHISFGMLHIPVRIIFDESFQDLSEIIPLIYDILGIDIEYGDGRKKIDGLVDADIILRFSINDSLPIGDKRNLMLVELD